MSKQSDLRNFFGKRNAETDQSLATVQSQISPNLLKKPAPKKD